jgi:hypothetical protein
MPRLRGPLLVVGGVLVLLVSTAYLLPRHARIARSVFVDVPRDAVFEQFRSFRDFNRWSPWYPLDPAAQYSYSGPESGIGAKMVWSGDAGSIGTGSLTVRSLTPPSGAAWDVDFGGQAQATMTFALEEDGARTRVTWALETDLGMNPVARYFGVIFSYMIGRDFDRGLAGLKRHVEGLARQVISIRRRTTHAAAAAV